MFDSGMFLLSFDTDYIGWKHQALCRRHFEAWTHPPHGSPNIDADSMSKLQVNIFVVIVKSWHSFIFIWWSFTYKVFERCEACDLCFLVIRHRIHYVGRVENMSKSSLSCISNISTTFMITDLMSGRMHRSNYHVHSKRISLYLRRDCVYCCRDGQNNVYTAR